MAFQVTLYKTYFIRNGRETNVIWFSTEASIIMLGKPFSMQHKLISIDWFDQYFFIF